MGPSATDASTYRICGTSTDFCTFGIIGIWRCVTTGLSATQSRNCTFGISTIFVPPQKHHDSVDELDFLRLLHSLDHGSRHLHSFFHSGLHWNGNKHQHILRHHLRHRIKHLLCLVCRPYSRFRFRSSLKKSKETAATPRPNLDVSRVSATTLPTSWSLHHGMRCRISIAVQIKPNKTTTHLCLAMPSFFWWRTELPPFLWNF